MPFEMIYKLQPTRTMHLRGFDNRGAAAALVEVTETSWKLRGVFRDMADFAVLMLWDADNTFEHPRLRYLPDFDFSGMVLDFDISISGVQNPASVLHQWIPWGALSYQLPDGTGGTIPWSDIAEPHTAPVAASAEVAVVGDDPQWYDRVTLWYQNFAWDYIVPGPTRVEWEFYAGTPGTIHSITISSRSYIYVEQDGDSSAAVAAALIGMINNGSGDPDAIAETGAVPWAVRLRRRRDDGSVTPVSGSGGIPSALYQIGPETVAEAIVAQINGTDWSAVTMPLSATRSGTTITITAQRPGADGNRIRLYTQSKTATLGWSNSTVALSGGTSPTSWHVALDFSARGLSQLRRLWMTFSPALPFAATYQDTEWSVTVTQWTVSDPQGRRALRLAGPGSVRVNSRDSWVRYLGSGWAEEAGWYDGGFARRTGTIGDAARITYHCQHQHDLYLGTSLYRDRGTVAVFIDGAPAGQLSCALDEEPALVTRRHIAASLPAGKHTVELRLTTDGWFYFDFLEAVVPSNAVPDPPEIYEDVTAAIDYDTDHTYKLPPARLVWNLERLGLRGPLNEYVGVFWWNQRRRNSAVPAASEIYFEGPFEAGGSIFLHFGRDQFGNPTAPTIGKTVFPADDALSIARHFAFAINGIFVACWAEAQQSGSGAVLRIWQHSPHWTVYVSVQNEAGGTVSGGGDLIGQPPQLAIWEIDDEAEEPINVAARAWHSDLFRILADKNWPIVEAFSLELVHPPERPGAVYAARFPDGTPVETDVGFANLKSTHCTFGGAMLEYQKGVYRAMAALMADAGLVPWLQFGEFVWWFFARRAVPIIAASNSTPIVVETAYDHGIEAGQTVLVAGVRGNAAANGRWVVQAATARTITLAGSSGSGTFQPSPAATVRGGGMAFYDAATAAAAQAALGRPLAAFWTQDDDPSVNGGADVAFLRARVKQHIDAIRAHVLAEFPQAKFELLFPVDVTHSEAYWTADLPYPQGGRLNHDVSLPTEYQQQYGSGLDRLKIEALSWGSFYRNGDLASAAVRFATDVLAWPRAAVAYLLPIFNGGCPWEREYLAARNAGIPIIALWAFDHICLLSWPLPLPRNVRSAGMY